MHTFNHIMLYRVHLDWAGFELTIINIDIYIYSYTIVRFSNIKILVHLFTKGNIFNMITYQMLTSRATGLTPSFLVVGSMLLVFLIFCVVFCFLCPLFCLPNAWLSLRFSQTFMSYKSLIDEHTVILKVHKWYIQSCHVIKSLSVIVWTIHV
jgi:hypothetical protein